MKTFLSRLECVALLIILLVCLSFTNSCYAFFGWKNVKAYEGPDLAKGEYVNFYLDRSVNARTADMPIDIVEVDGKPFYRTGVSLCLFILPGKHKVTINPEFQRYHEVEKITTITTWSGRIVNMYPDPAHLTFEFTAEKGREYILLDDTISGSAASGLKEIVDFWIEDKNTKEPMTDKVRIVWKEK